MPDDVHFVRSDGLALLDVLPGDHFDRIFMSNDLEHLPSGVAVVKQLRIVAGLLKRDGRAIIPQPDISLVGSPDPHLTLQGGVDAVSRAGTVVARHSWGSSRQVHSGTMRSQGSSPA